MGRGHRGRGGQEPGDAWVRAPRPGPAQTLLLGKEAGPAGPAQLPSAHHARRPDPAVRLRKDQRGAPDPTLHAPRPNIRPQRGQEAKKKDKWPQSNRKPKPTRFKSKSSRQLVRPPRRRAPRAAGEGRAQDWVSRAPRGPRPASNPTSNPAPNSVPGASRLSPPRWGRRSGGGSVLLPEPGTPAPTLSQVARSPSPPWPPAPSHPGRAPRAPPKVSEGAESCGLAAGGRLPRAASAGSSARQSRGARRGGMPARRLPAASGGGLLRPAGGARAHTRAQDCPTGGGGPLLPSPSWLEGDAALSRPRRPVSAPTIVPPLRPRPAPCTPHPCAPSHGRGTSEALGRRALRPRPAGPAPGSRPRRSLRSRRPLPGRAPPRAWTSPAPPWCGARVPNPGPPGLGAAAVRSGVGDRP